MSDERQRIRSGPPKIGRARVALTLAALLVGCGEEGPSYPCTNLGGVVTVDKVPLREGTIAFLSLDETNGHYVMAPIVHGRYIAEDVPLGKVLAVITASEETSRPSSEPGESATVTTNLIPPKYQSGFNLDVTPKTSQIDFLMTHEQAEPSPATVSKVPDNPPSEPAQPGDAGRAPGDPGPENPPIAP